MWLLLSCWCPVLTLTHPSLALYYLCRAMALFGGPLTVQHKQARLLVGGRGWVSFHCEPRVGVLAKALRAALSRLLSAKIEDPGLDLQGSPVVEAILRLLRGNGM